ncbi:MAG TPA: hypothetical protein VK806_10545 [Bacteroidia bacterium]|jgi:hypothetical protein|nr:hypothetical protein [Bacteroidia bacterium]
MKSTILIPIAIFFLSACGHQGQELQTQNQKTQDSLMVVVQQKDSALTDFVNSIDRIQANLDSVKTVAHILKVNSEAKASTGTIVEDVKLLGRMIIADNKALAALEVRLKKSDKKNASLEDMVQRLGVELNYKDTEIVGLQETLVETNNTLQITLAQLNDSINVAVREREKIGMMQADMNTVYYAIGTMKTLKHEGIITKEGGFIGIGREAVLNNNISASAFIKADKTVLQHVALDAGFVKVITEHPTDSYTVTNTVSASLDITNADAFWSKSKYLVVVIK